MTASLPPVGDILTLEGFLMVFLFIILSSPAAYRLTGKYSEGMVQMVIHGLLLWYLFLFIVQLLPASGKFGFNKGISPSMTI